MSLGDKVQYWDTCIFLAWIKNECRLIKEETNGWKVLIHNLEERKIHVVTSSITLAELHYGKYFSNSVDPQEAHELEKDFFKALTQGIFRICTFDQQAGMLAKEIRDYFNVNKTSCGKSGRISLADSVHLATAIQMKVHVFQTFDKNELKKNNNLGLASLKGDPGVLQESIR